MTLRIAHVVREGGLLTEPFIAHRVAAQVAGFESEQWSEQGPAPEGIENVRAASRLVAPASAAARVFHHVPQLGAAQRRAYRELAGVRRPDLIHAHYLTSGYLASTTGRPLVVSAYGFDVSVMPRRPLWRRAYRQLADRAQAVLVEGPHMRDTVVTLGFPEARVRIVGISVGHEHLLFAPPIVPLDNFTLLIAGRLVTKKGHAIAIQAFRRVLDRYPTARLEVIGRGPLEVELRSLSRQLGVTDALSFLGSLPRDLYLERMRAADLFLAPSVTAPNGDSEGGAPTTILDAQAVGTIVIGSTHADIPFLVSDEVTGFLAPEGDSEGLVGAIDRALASRDRWAVIASTARKQILDHHSDVALSESLGDVYRSALA